MPLKNPSTSLLKRILLIAFIILLAGCSVLPSSSNQTEETPQLPQPKTLTDPTEIELNDAIQTAIQGREDVLAFLLYRLSIDHVDYSADKNLALVWTALVDRDTGLVQSGEPGLVIAHRVVDAAGAKSWTVVFQADNTFAGELTALPDSLISADAKAHYMPAEQQQQKAGTVYSGYRLPWTGGEMHYLTGSIGHVYTYKSCPSTCLYAFDFANGTMFPVRAAKAGTVKYAEWEYPNGNTTNPNYLILEDTTTTPTTYQVYYHLAQNSIPADLRVPGARVVQGQFIGNADDTGYSTGNHLHFMVHTNPTSTWGTSVDITFDDVTVNGGRPRLCTEASAYPQFGSECMPSNKYISGNLDSSLPTGTITDPVPYTAVNASTLNVSGTLSDDTGILQAQLMITNNGTWMPIGGILLTSPFTTQINLCQANIPDGKFFLALQVEDAAGKVSAANTALTELEKQADCSTQPPVCTPSEMQAAIYTQPNFQGDCQLLDIGNYNDLDAMEKVKAGLVKSVQVGSGVSALLFSEREFAGTIELLQNADSDLADNPAGVNGLGSLQITSRILPPVAPVLAVPAPLSDTSEITLTWSVLDGIETRSTLVGPNAATMSLDWQTGGAWTVGVLPAGDYTWTVEARNMAGTTTVTQEFTVIKNLVPPESALQPLTEFSQTTALQLEWQVTGGADRIDHFELQYRINSGDWQSYDQPLEGTLRQLVFTAQPGVKYEFRIRAIGNDGTAEAFTETAEAVTQIQDAAICSPDSFELYGDNAREGAQTLTIGVKQEHNWCPGTDQDWVVFTATMGDTLHISTEPETLNSAAAFILYEMDGSTLIGNGQPADANSGAALDWIVPADGIYYLQVQPVDQSITGSDARYSLSVSTKGTVQPATLVCGSISIPALLAGVYAAAKQMKKKKINSANR